MLKNLKNILLSISYKIPFLNFKFTTQDLVEPKFIKYEEYRANLQDYKKKYITEEVLEYNVQTVKLIDKHLKSKYLLLDIGKAFNDYFKNEKNNNLLIIVNDTENYFEIIFINTVELYEDFSYVVKRYDKTEVFYENNIKNISFLFAFYAPVTTGISIMSNKKLSFLDNNDNVYYLTQKEQKAIMKKVSPFEKTSTTLLRIFNTITILLIPLILSNYLYFTYKSNLEKKIKNENKVLYSKIYDKNKINSTLKKNYNKILNNISDKRKLYTIKNMKKITLAVKKINKNINYKGKNNDYQKIK